MADQPLDLREELWQSVGIAHGPLRAPAEHIVEQRKADRLLRRMDAHERVRVAWQQSRDGALREAFGKRYSELLGIRPEVAEDARRALRELPDGATVEGIVGALGGCQENGLVGESEAEAPPGRIAEDSRESIRGD